MFEAIESPCIRNCCLDENNICLGCFRALDEIVVWTKSDDACRQTILANARMRRAAYQNRLNNKISNHARNWTKMSETATVLPALIGAVQQTIADHAEEIAQLDQAIGDGDHVSNLQRGLAALAQQADGLSELTWQAALQKMGMTIMSSVGGASGSLYGTLFVAMSKQIQQQAMSRVVLAAAFGQGVESVKLRGKADKGEKTMLDVLIPVAQLLARPESQDCLLADLLSQVKQVAESGVEATRDMIATKGRASFLGERSKGHLDAGAKSSQLMISAIADVLKAG